MKMFKAEWILCPCCGAKTKTKAMENTILENFPLFCPRCKHETIIQVKQFHTTVIKEPDAQTQSR